MLNHTIPYFGEYETIKKIERENNYYIITKYKNNDEELDKWKLFVNEIVTKKLEGEFYGDLEKYLLNNLNKYKKAKQYSVVEDKIALTNVLLIVGSMTIVTLIVLALNITSLPVIMTMLNVVIAVTSFTSLITIVSFIIGKLPKNNNNNKFIKSYENFQDILENYRLDNYKDKQNDLVKTNAKTEFTEITPIEQNYNLTEIKSKIKSKIKEHE